MDRNCRHPRWEITSSLVEGADWDWAFMVHLSISTGPGTSGTAARSSTRAHRASSGPPQKLGIAGPAASLSGGCTAQMRHSCSRMTMAPVRVENLQMPVAASA